VSDLERLISDAVTRAVGELNLIVRQCQPDDRRVALHEAAHAVIGYVVGDRPLVEVGLGPDGSGCTRRESIVDGVGEDTALLRARVERAIVAIYAGVEADGRTGQLDWLRALPDIRQVDRLAEYVVSKDRRPDFLARLRALAEMAVSHYWPTIEALASMLQRDRRLTGRDVERYLGHARPGCFEGLLTPQPERPTPPIERE
jgi:hypothetical protein